MERRRAWDIPAPLVDSPKCPRCSLVGICLPDETLRAAEDTERDALQLPLFEEAPRKPVHREVRPLITPRSEMRPLYLNTQGVRVGKSGGVLQVKDNDKVVQEVRLGETCQVNLFGNVQISTQAVQALCEAETPICYFSTGAWFYGITNGLNERKRILTKKSVPSGRAGVLCPRVSAPPGSGQGTEPENAPPTEPCRAQPQHAQRTERNGGAR